MLQTDMKCIKCGLLIGRGSMGTTIPLCQCQWNAEDFKRPEDHESLYSRLIAELSSTKEKLEAAEKRIRESQEQEPCSYEVYDTNGVIYSASYKAACHEHINDAINDFDLNVAWLWKVRPVYTMPPIPPELAELQRENAELRKQLEAAEALLTMKTEALNAVISLQKGEVKDFALKAINATKETVSEWQLKRDAEIMARSLEGAADWYDYQDAIGNKSYKANRVQDELRRMASELRNN